MSPERNGRERKSDLGVWNRKGRTGLFCSCDHSAGYSSLGGEKRGEKEASLLRGA